MIMNTFGNIKTNIERVASELAKKPEFKRFIFEFNGLVLKNKDISELYSIYDDLSSNKGIAPDIVNDYVNESIEYSQILLESQRKNIVHLNNWISSWTKSNKNDYSDIDNAVYNNSIRNLESVLESKNNIKKTLISEEKITVKENINLPISSMVSIANKTLSKQISNLSEGDKKELESILTMDYDTMKKDFNSLKEDVVKKLKITLNESSESSVGDSISKTIEKIMDAKCNYYDYYKLKKLNLGL
jgi:hypothetical protein